MNKYIYERSDWTNFSWDSEKISILLGRVNAARGLLLGKMQLLGLISQDEICLNVVADGIAKSSKIEGEILDIREVRSSVAHRLGIELDESTVGKRDVDGIVEATLDAIYDSASPLTEDRLCAWQAALFPSGYSGLQKIAVGRFRDDSRGKMQVVSGSFGRRKVHYQAPPAEDLEREMSCFLRWFNQDGNSEPVLKALLAHFWFVTLHPFEDGNGRLARIISEMQLAKADGMPKRFYSLPARIEKTKKQYYQVLEDTQRGDKDITAYLVWSLNCLLEAISASEDAYLLVFAKHRFLHNIPKYQPNPRQKKIVDLLFGDFKGHLTTSKYASIAKTSQDTAARDIAQLVSWGVLTKTGGGRSTHYRLSV
ncbi:MAG: Fic family protein [Synergistaceae bacterium]|jgi:Fic family protein|nr:Fic family protein [Synergistaceae bacterium]